MRFEEEFNNAKALRDKHRKKVKQLQKKMNRSEAVWGSFEDMELQVKLEAHRAAAERAEMFMETFNPF